MDAKSQDSFRSAYLRRLRNQAANLITSGMMILLISSGVMGGAIAGMLIGRGASASSLVVVLTTSIGFALGMIVSSALSPRIIRVGFRATPVREPSLLRLLEELRTATDSRLEFDLFAVDESEILGFGHNVVVTGLPKGRGILRPAIFASRSVLRGCSEDELYSIFAHELAHLHERHLVKRVLGGVLHGIGGSLAASCMLVGLQLMGMSSVALLLATVAPVLPVALIWINLQRLIEVQEKEADWIAISRFHARPLDLLNALKKLTFWNDSGIHPLVKDRMLILQGLWLSENARTAIPQTGTRTAA